MSKTDAAQPNSLETMSMSDVVKQTQFRISFFSTFAGHLASMGLQWMNHAAMALYERSAKYNSEDRNFVEKHHADGVESLRLSNYPDALQNFTHARAHFERTLFAFSKANTRLHQLYYTICYNQAYAYVQHGNLDKARIVLLQAEQQLQTWGAVYRDYDVCNLLGVTHLKEGNFPEARKQFEKSLAITPNQRDIIYLRIFTVARTDAADEKLNPINQENFDYLTDTKLFNSGIAHPVAFEVNMALILSLKDVDPARSAILFQQLENFYAAANIAHSDRMRIYRVGIDILEQLKKIIPAPMAVDEKAVKSNGSGSAGVTPLPNPKQQLQQLGILDLYGAPTVTASDDQLQKFLVLFNKPGEIDKRIKAFEAKKRIEENAYKLHQAQASAVPQSAVIDQKKPEVGSDAKQNSQDKIRLFKIGAAISTAAAFSGVVVANIMKAPGR